MSRRTARTARPRAAASTRGRPAPGWAGHGDLAASIALVFPLVLAYGIGAAIVRETSAVDVVTHALWTACDRRFERYLLVYAALAIGYLVWLHRHGRRGAVTLAAAGPMLLEAAVYALTLGAAIGLVLDGVAALGAATVVGALGAGLHEELVFRLGGMAGGAALLRRANVPPQVALAVALVASSLLFAAAHHWAGEPYDARVFAFRTLAGAAFGLVCWHRSLAHAVYAHVLYDLWVAL